jgi:hypothetical protein
VINRLNSIYQAYHELGVVISVDEWMSIPSVKAWYAKEKTIRKYYVEAGLAGSAQDDVCLGKLSPARPKK